MQPQSSLAAHWPPPLIAPPSAVKLAGHLEATIAACLELASHSPASLGYFYEDEVRRLELRAIMHLLQARECARETASYDRRLQECVELFIAGTEALERAPAVTSEELMLGRRLAVTTAQQFASLMLQAWKSAYPHVAEAEIADEDFAIPAGAA
jgi:hypothetical protein